MVWVGAFLLAVGLALGIAPGNGAAVGAQVIGSTTTSEAATTSTSVPATTTTRPATTTRLDNVTSGGAPATWYIDRNDPPTPGTTSFTALVSRVSCSDGRTGQVLAPNVAVEHDRIVVTFEVEALPPGRYTCPGNNDVPYRVDVREPIGSRSIVDGWCLDRETPEPGLCPDAGVRWSAPPTDVDPARPARPHTGRATFTG